MIAERGAEKLGKARGLADPRDKPVPLRLREGGEVKRREGGVKFVQVTLLSPSSTPPSRHDLVMVLPVLSVFPALLLLPLLALAHPTPNSDDPGCKVNRALPSRWYHEEGHPVERLFKRQGGGNPTDGTTYPEVGSSEWSAGFPSLRPDVSKLPDEWVDALNQAVAGGKIPNISVAKVPSGNGGPTYPSGVNPGGPEVCSGSEKCKNPDDIWDAPDGVLAISFDDGPSLVSA